MAELAALGYAAKYEATTLWCALLVIPGTVVAFTLVEIARRRGRPRQWFRTRLDSDARRRAALGLADVRDAARRAERPAPPDNSADQSAARSRILAIAAAAKKLGDPYDIDDGRKIAALVVFGRSAEFYVSAMESRRGGGSFPRPCFFDPMHHQASGERLWRPEASAGIRVPVCGECSRALGKGDQPRSLGVRHGRKIVPYWTLQDGVFTKTGFGAFGDLAETVLAVGTEPPVRTEATHTGHFGRRTRAKAGWKGRVGLPIAAGLLAGVIGAVITVGTEPLTGSAHGHMMLFGIPVYGVFIGLLAGLFLGGIGCVPIFLGLLIARYVGKLVKSVESYERR